MTGLFEFASIELLLMWALWLFPFIRKRFTGTKRKSIVMAHSGNWGLVLESLGIFLAWLRSPHAPEPAQTRMLAAMVLAPLGAWFGWLAVWHLGKQLRILAGLYADHELIRTGPYAIVRHPVYASMFIMMLATGLLLAWWPLLLLGIALYIAGTEIRIRAEESLLRARFGREFEEYRRQVPAYIPFVR